jgi:hypothetical protein
MASFDLGPEAVLPDWDNADEPVDEAIENLARALRFIGNWKRQLSPENLGEVLNYDRTTVSKVEQTERKVNSAFAAWSKQGLTFPGNNEVNLYKQAQLAYPDTWRSVMLSVGSLEQEGFFDSLSHLPGDIAGSLGGTVTDIVLNALKSLWPVLLIAALIIVGYVFRAHIFKAR